VDPFFTKYLAELDTEHLLMVPEGSPHLQTIDDQAVADAALGRLACPPLLPPDLPWQDDSLEDIREPPCFLLLRQLFLPGKSQFVDFPAISAIA